MMFFGCQFMMKENIDYLTLIMIDCLLDNNKLQNRKIIVSLYDSKVMIFSKMKRMRV